MKNKIETILYLLLLIVCPVCYKQLNIRIIKNVGKKGKGTYKKVKLSNDNVIVLEDIHKL